MPSVMFFQEDENPGKLKQGLRKVFRNKFLLLHILIFSLIAVSLADPYITQKTTTEESTIYLDATSNTAEDFSQIKQYAVNQLSERNNLVVAGYQTDIYTDLSRSQAREAISEIESTEVYPNTGSTISSVESLEGDLFIASNLADMTSSESHNLIDNLDDDRSVGLYTQRFENSWGITDYRISGEKAELYIKNYKKQRSEIEIQVNSGDVQSFEIGPNKLKTAELELVDGKNNISLSSDEFSIDNSIYIQNPSSPNTQVKINGDLPYMQEVVKAIPSTDLTTQNPDILVTSQLSSTDNLFEKVDNGLNLVYMPQEEVSNSNLPVTNLEDSTSDITINRPVTKQLYNTEYLSGTIDPAAESLTHPKSAIVKMDKGKGVVIQYNIIDNSFSRSIMFPLFWKPVFHNMTETVDIQESNIMTGQQAGKTLLTVQGYSTVNNNRYAVSTTGSFPPKKLGAESETSFSTAPKSLSTQINLLVALLLLLESILLFRERVI